MSRFTDAIARNLEGCEAFSVGACPGCKTCGLGDEPSENEREQAEESHFSWSACDSCGSTLGGDRHPAHFLIREPGAETLVGAELYHCDVCTDCLFYHANGDEPEAWESEE